MEDRIPRLLDFDPNRQSAPPRDAATVIVLRASASGLEVFCVRRHARSAFLGGALVFPGGKVDPADADPRWDVLAGTPQPRGELFAGRATARALAVAALRETLEEGAILPVEGGALDGDGVEAIRGELSSGTALATALERRRLRLALDGLAPWARWVTPEAEARRFDARFFLLEVPSGQVGRHDQRETTESFWEAPRRVLERGAAGEFFLAPPTARTLELLSEAGDVQAAMAMAARQSLAPICPRFVAANEPYLALPGDPSHDVPERRVDGPTRYVLRDGRFVAEDAPVAARGGGTS